MEKESEFIKRDPFIQGILEKPGQLFEPNRFLFQWHITENCNQRCLHCYQEDKMIEQLPLEKLEVILLKFIEFIQELGVQGHINFTGGEPLLHPEFFLLLERLQEHKDLISFGVLSNGTLLDAEKIKHLKRLGCRYVQLSIDGNEIIHNSIRGEGNLEKVLKALKLLRKHKLFSLVSFTAHRGNFHTVGDVIQLAKKHGAGAVWSDRLIPCGSAEKMQDEMLSTDDVRDYFRELYHQKKKLQKSFFTKTRVRMHRALQFMELEKNGDKCTPYRCNAGRGLLTVLPDGSLVPCRRMPIVLGDVLKSGFLKVYQGSLLLHSLRSEHSIPEECQPCAHAEKCAGGLKCLAYSYAGSPFRADPQCYLIRL